MPGRKRKDKDKFPDILPKIDSNDMKLSFSDRFLPDFLSHHKASENREMRRFDGIASRKFYMVIEVGKLEDPMQVFLSGSVHKERISNYLSFFPEPYEL
jgi:hypothetical protein